MSVRVEVNNQPYVLFKQLDIRTSLDTFCKEARIITTESTNDDSFLKINDLVKIYIDNILKVTGYAEVITDAETNESHDLSYSIRDSVADIIDSSVPDNVKSLKNVTSFKQLCQLAISGLGLNIQVIDEIGGVFGDIIKAAEIGKNCNEFLQEYARKLQVFLNSDGSGNILIRRPSGLLTTKLLSVKGGFNNNILDSSVTIDYRKRFYKYVVRSGDNVGIAFDNNVRTSRYFEKVAESTMTADECANAAKEEANIRRIRSFAYNCKIAGYSANGELFEDGKLVEVMDPSKGVVGQYVIKDCNYVWSDGGELTTMNLTDPDAYTVEANLSPAAARTTTTGTPYTIQSGDTLSEISSRFNLTIQDITSINPQITNPDQIQSGQVINIPVTGGN